MLSPPEQQQQHHHPHQNPLSHLLENISSYDGNVMLAAVISLLLVILFVLLLHIYAKWFLQQARHRRRRSGSSRRRVEDHPSLSNMLRPGRLHHFDNVPFDNNNNNTTSSVSSKGLEASTIASIPLFVYTSNINDNGGDNIQGLECVVCLSVFEDSDVGRCLPKCGHSFHVECIDMWLHSHTNCPICRAPVVPEKTIAMEVHDHDLIVDEHDDGNPVETGAELVEIVVVDQQGRESNCEINEQIQDVGLLNHDRLSSSSSSSSSSSGSSLGSSLKRMLSWNSTRSDHQSKVFPSSDNSNNNANVELGD